MVSVESIAKRVRQNDRERGEWAKIYGARAPDLWWKGHYNADGTPVRLAGASKIQRWKRQPRRFEFSLKRGFYGPFFRIRINSEHSSDIPLNELLEHEPPRRKWVGLQKFDVTGEMYKYANGQKSGIKDFRETVRARTAKEAKMTILDKARRLGLHVRGLYAQQHQRAVFWREKFDGR